MEFKLYVAVCIDNNEVKGVGLQVPVELQECSNDTIDTLVTDAAEGFSQAIGKEIIALYRITDGCFDSESFQVTMPVMKEFIETGKAVLVSRNDFKMKYLQCLFEKDENCSNCQNSNIS